MARGVSTVVDVSLALLLVSASVLTLVAATPPDTERGHHRSTAALLAATTTRVAYPGGNASGTVAGLLADATASDAPGGFRDAVRETVERALRQVPTRAQAIARPAAGERVAVGQAPPPAADVGATTFTVGRNGTPVRIVVRTWSR